MKELAQAKAGTPGANWGPGTEGALTSSLEQDGCGRRADHLEVREGLRELARTPRTGSSKWRAVVQGLDAQGESAWKLLPPARLKPLGRDICPRSEQGEAGKREWGPEGRGSFMTAQGFQ